jgi:putative spermidine/putrescine transport system substrate-binding protein
VPLPPDVASKFLPEKEYARAKSVNWGEMSTVQKSVVDRYLAEVH